MAKPTWKYPGVLEGRIVPVGTTYQGYDVGGLYSYSVPELYAGYWWYYGYTVYEGYGQGHVFCLGDDSLIHPYYRINIGDTISVEQEFDISSAQKLLRFVWHMRQPSNMPSDKTIVSAGTVSFKDGDLVTSGDGAVGVIVANPANNFTRLDSETLFQIGGATESGNDGIFRISGVPTNQKGVTGGDRAIVENASLVGRDDDTGVTIEQVPLQWVSRAYVDTGSGFVERVKLIEEPGHTHYRDALALHLSQFTGTLTVKFETKLELVA